MDIIIMILDFYRVTVVTQIHLILSSKEFWLFYYEH